MHLSALLIEDFLEWAGLSIANFQPEKKTMWIWPHREWSLIFPPMNRKAGIKRVFWRRRCGQVGWPEGTLIPQGFDTAAPTPGRCGPVVPRCLPVRLLLLSGRGRKRERVVESLFQHLTGRTGGADGSSSEMSCDPAGRWGEKASSPPSASSTPPESSKQPDRGTLNYLHFTNGETEAQRS